MTMLETEILKSAVDPSVNFVVKQPDGGFFESRYVRREGRYFTLYLSSHSGCVKACRFCHLTQTGQTTFANASKDELMAQADLVLDHYRREVAAGACGAASFVYYSFMARGEPLASRVLLGDGDGVLSALGELAAAAGLASRFCLSTIMPVEMRRRELSEVFRYTRPMLYYSLYSLDDAFRRKWLPQALPPAEALAKLARWQQETGMLVKIHGAIIKEENDSPDNWNRIMDEVERFKLRVTFNLVAYNSFDRLLGEPGDTSAVEAAIRGRGFAVKIKDRVGLDVKASCGMFVTG